MESAEWLGASAELRSSELSLAPLCSHSLISARAYHGGFEATGSSDSVYDLCLIIAANRSRETTVLAGPVSNRRTLFLIAMSPFLLLRLPSASPSRLRFCSSSASFLAWVPGQGLASVVGLAGSADKYKSPASQQALCHKAAPATHAAPWSKPASMTAQADSWNSAPVVNYTCSPSRC